MALACCGGRTTCGIPPSLRSILLQPGRPNRDEGAFAAETVAVIRLEGVFGQDFAQNAGDGRVVERFLQAALEVVLGACVGSAFIASISSPLSTAGSRIQPRKSKKNFCSPVIGMAEVVCPFEGVIFLSDKGCSGTGIYLNWPHPVMRGRRYGTAGDMVCRPYRSPDGAGAIYQIVRRRWPVRTGHHEMARCRGDLSNRPPAIKWAGGRRGG